VSLDKLTLEQFQAALHTMFRLQQEGGACLKLELVEAAGVQVEAGGKGGRNFSIVFKGPADPFLPQRTYTIEHDAMGSFELFMVPVGQDPDGFQYQAIFNRRGDAS